MNNNIAAHWLQKIKGQQKESLFLLLLMYTLASHGFSYANWSHVFTELFAYSLVLMTIISFWNKAHYNQTNFMGIVFLFMFTPFFSIFNAYSIYDQSFIASISAIFTNTFIWILYFLLHYYKVKETTILKTFLYIGLFTAFVQIIQQITYPHVLFGVRSDESMVGSKSNALTSMRNGLWRFRIDIYYMPLFFALLTWIKEKMNYKNSIIFGVFLVSIYLTLTRQIMFSALLTILVSFFLGKSQNKIKFIIFVFVFMAVLVFYFEALFGNLFSKTQSELTEDYVRFQAVDYYWNEAQRNVFTFLFGYGGAKEGAFANQMQYLNEIGLCYNDIGFIGMIWRFGICYVVLSYYLLYYLFAKLKNKIPSYIRLYIFYASIMTIMYFPFGVDASITIVWPIILYICDLHINKSPLALR